MTVRIWDVASGRELYVLTGHRDRVNGVTFAPDGRSVLSTSDDGTIRLWNPQTGREIWRIDGLPSAIYRAQFSPDGRKIAAAGLDGSVRFWDAATRKELHRSAITATAYTRVAFSHDGSSAVASTDTGRSIVVDAGTALITSEQQAETIFGYSAGGDAYLASDGANKLRLHDTSTRAPVTELVGSGSAKIWEAAIAPDGRTIAAALGDGRVMIWGLDRRNKQLIDFACTLLDTALEESRRREFNLDAVPSDPTCGRLPPK
jgi:WD40 repeat protein